MAAAPTDRTLTERQLLGFMLAASVASTIGGLPFNALPVMLGSVADSFRLDAPTVGLLGSICFGGYLAGTLAAPWWIGRVNWRLLTLASAVATAGAFAASATVRALPALQLSWALIGFFASTMTCLGLRILGDLPHKVRAFGVRQGIELSVTAAVLFALPPLVIARWGYTGAALALAAVVAVLGLSAFQVPARPLAAPGDGAAVGRVAPAAWAAIGVFFVFLAGNIGLWSFLERIGSSRNIAPAQLGLVFAVLKLLGGAAAFAMGAVGDRLATRGGRLAVLALTALGLLLLGLDGGFGPYAAGAWLWEFGFTCGCILQTAHIARCDPGGRAILLVPAAFAFSSMVGPAVAGTLFAGGSALPLLGLAAVCALASLVVPQAPGSAPRPTGDRAR